MIKFSALQVEDGRAFHHPNVGAIAIENIAAHDRSPSEAPGPSCACWTRIARQFGRHAGPACHLQALFESGAAGDARSRMSLIRATFACSVRAYNNALHGKLRP